MEEKYSLEIEKALSVISNYGATDGSFHKMWVIDQVVRALTGCPRENRSVNINFIEYGINDKYIEWVKNYSDGEDGPDTYEWDTGIAP